MNTVKQIATILLIAPIQAELISWISDPAPLNQEQRKPEAFNYGNEISTTRLYNSQM